MTGEGDRKAGDEFTTEIGHKASRRLRARRRAQAGGIWHGLGMFGMVGWSVAIPTLLGAIAGGWLDDRVPVSFSWRLTLLVVGLAIGCLNAWYWVARERDLIGRDLGDDE